MLNKERVDAWNSLRFGVVLSGGGAKGAYEAGALQAMYDLDIVDKVFGVSGTSVGALNTVIFAMDDIKLLDELWKNITFGTVVTKKDKNEFSEVKSFIKGQLRPQTVDEPQGLCTQDAMRELLERVIDGDRIRKNKAELFVCAYNISEHRPEYICLNGLDDGDILDAALASSAIPHVYDPVSFRGQLYIDGGINDPVYGIKNSDVTPLLPLAHSNLDIIFVIHLRARENDPPSPKWARARVIDVYPSRPLEPIKGTGAMFFTHASIEEKISLGYSDMCRMLSRLIIEFLK